MLSQLTAHTATQLFRVSYFQLVMDVVLMVCGFRIIRVTVDGYKMESLGPECIGMIGEDKVCCIPALRS